MKEKKLIMFDFDGVLVDTFGISYEIGKEVNPGMSEDTYRSFWVGNINESVAAYMKDHKSHPRFHERYVEKTRTLAVPAAVHRLVAALAEQYRLTIVSSSPTSSILAILDREGLSGFFSDILGLDVAASKVVKIKLLLEKYSVAPAETIFVTDTVGDVREARQCGVAAIAVTWGFQKREVLAESQPLAVVDSLRELESALAEFFGSEGLRSRDS